MLQILVSHIALALTAAAGSFTTVDLPRRSELDAVRGGAHVGASTPAGVMTPAAVIMNAGGIRSAALGVPAPSRDWTGKAEDNICGLRDLTQVSNPVVIDFQACLDATPEMKKIKSEKIDPKSPEGIRLVTEATNRVTQACEAVQRANGYCSVWKSIRHKDGRTVTDISSQVTAQF
jgi:hypothetical protein